MTAPAFDDTPDIGAAVRALMPQLRQYSLVALVVLLGLGLVTLALAIWAIRLMQASDKDAKLVAAFAVLGIAAILYTWARLRRAQEALVMPVLASAVGLSFDKNAKPFLATLPPRLLPQKAVIHAEDHVHGNLGAHRIDMAEVRVETGGKNSKTLFRGLVARFPNSIALPEFFLAPEAKTRPGMFFGAWMPTEGLTHLRSVSGRSGEAYGLWCPQGIREGGPALPAVLKVLAEVETGIGVSTSLFSAVSTGREMFVALSHSGNLFRIGGLFPSEAQVFDDVSAATQDLSIVLNLARQLIAVEEAAARSG